MVNAYKTSSIVGAVEEAPGKKLLGLAVGVPLLAKSYCNALSAKHWAFHDDDRERHFHIQVTWRQNR
jgi:hypothetical protein